MAQTNTTERSRLASSLTGLSPPNWELLKLERYLKTLKLTKPGPCLCSAQWGGDWREYESPPPTLGILLKLPKARLLLLLLLWHSSHLIVRSKGHGPVVRGGSPSSSCYKQGPPLLHLLYWGAEMNSMGGHGGPSHVSSHPTPP